MFNRTLKFQCYAWQIHKLYIYTHTYAHILNSYLTSNQKNRDLLDMKLKIQRKDMKQKFKSFETKLIIQP